MVQISHSGTNKEKIDEILASAQKLFGTFGLEKTTMNDIAKDLGISKAALYYYYPDKENLYKAVVEKETETFLMLLDNKLASIDNPAEQIKIYAETRLDFYRTLLNLSRIRIGETKGIKCIMNDLRQQLRKKENEKISSVLTMGIHIGLFEIKDPFAISELFLDTLRGISLIYKRNKDIIYLSDEDFIQLKTQVMCFINIFIKGISKTK